jgi:hypothetical protein
MHDKTRQCKTWHGMARRDMTVTLHCKAIHVTVKEKKRKKGKVSSKERGRKKFDSMRKEKWWMMFFYFF